MKTNGKTRSLTTTETSLKLLEHVRREGGARLVDLTEALDKPKSTLYSHLHTLEERGYLVAEGEEYHVGLKLLQFGESARNRKPMYDRAREYVDELVDETGEEGGFQVEENGRSIMIYNSAASPRSAAFAPGMKGYMHDNAAGKATLAEMSTKKVESIVDRWGLPARTEQTITDPNELSDEMATIRERGYATTDSEYTEGLCAIGVAVTEPDDTVFGAFSLGIPSYRKPRGQPNDELTRAVQNVADALEEDLVETSSVSK